MWSDSEIGALVARDLPDSSYVNLGIGLPQLVQAEVSPDREILFHSENGILGIGPRPKLGEEDADLIDAGKAPITLADGGCYFDHATSFSIIRGGHLDASVMGAFQVSQSGDLANWRTVDDALIPAVGGSMDLAVGASAVLIMMHLWTKQGDRRLKVRCTFPLTAATVVSRVYTELCVVEPANDRFRIRELAPGVSAGEIEEAIEGDVEFVGMTHLGATGDHR